MSQSAVKPTRDEIVEKLSQHVTAAAILARMCLPFTKDEFLDICGTAFSEASAVADKHGRGQEEHK